MITFEQLHETNKITPIVVTDNIENAVRLANLFLEHGINTMEITLRTPNAYKILESVAAKVPDMFVGAATVKSAGDFLSAYNSGANYIVSPGCTSELFVAARSHRSLIRYLPGVVTPSEAMFALNEGFNILKFFPCEDYNGYHAMQSISSPLPELKFCPAGGITLDKIKKYLLLPNVLSVGMDTLATRELVDNGDFAEITKRVKEAVAVVKNMQDK